MAEQNLKLLFIVNQAEFFISHRLPIAIAAKNNGYEVHIACADSPKIKYLTNLDFKVHKLKLKRSSILSIFFEFFEIYNLLKTIKFDMLHLVTIKPVLIGGIVARLANIKAVVYAITGLGFIFIATSFVANVKRFIIKLFYKVALKHKNSYIIFQNQDDVNLFNSNNLINSKQAVIIKGSGVDLEKFKPIAKKGNNDKVTVILAARMLRDKGVYEFNQAANILLARNINAKFILAGGLDEAGNPTRIPKSELLSFKNVNWIDHQNDMVTVLNSADIICLPSYREGLPKVLCEACACGLPIVTTDTPGCKDVVEDGKNGYLVPIKDANKLSDALEELIVNKDLREKFGKYSYKKALQEFNINKVISSTLNIYKKLLK